MNKLKELLINPAYFARTELAKHIKQMSGHLSGRTLDVGCGNKPYKDFFNTTEYIGMDYEGVHDHSNENIDVYYDGITFPFPENYFDSVVCTQVLEHVEHPQILISEIYRVLKPDGKALLTAPLVWGEHEVPHDYTRFTSFGIKKIFEETGFLIIEQQKTLNDIRAGFQMLNFYRFSSTWKSDRFFIIRLFTRSLFFAFNNISGLILYYIFPKNDDFYIDNLIVAKK